MSIDVNTISQTGAHHDEGARHRAALTPAVSQQRTWEPGVSHSNHACVRTNEGSTLDSAREHA